MSLLEDIVTKKSAVDQATQKVEAAVEVLAGKKEALQKTRAEFHDLIGTRQAFPAGELFNFGGVTAKTIFSKMGTGFFIMTAICTVLAPMTLIAGTLSVSFIIALAVPLCLFAAIFCVKRGHRD